MDNDIDDIIQNIALQLLSLKSVRRLNKTDQETIETIVNTNIPAIQKQLKDDREAQKTT